MKLLILSQYFPPETGAPQNRLYELAVRLKKLGVDVTVLTAMPNYPKMEIFEEYQGKNYHFEEIDGIPVHRTKIFVSKKKSIFHRLLNYFSFTISSYLKGRTLDNFDFILCNSPPLFLGYTAIALSKKLNAKLIFNVSDLWPESAEKLGIVTNKHLLKLAYNLEEKCYQTACLVAGQTQGIVKDISDRFPNKDVYWLPNGANLTDLNPSKIKNTGAFRKKYNIAPDDLVFFYGGILGHAQGLDLIIRAATQTNNERVKFVILGDGPLSQELKQLRNELNADNVVFAEPVSKQEIPAIISEIDISLVPLKNLPLFKGAIPSKIFEILAMEKPILLGVDGEARELFIEQANAGWYFEPENLSDLVNKIEYISCNIDEIYKKGISGRKYVAENFDRQRIAENFLNKIKAI